MKILGFISIVFIALLIMINCTREMKEIDQYWEDILKSSDRSIEAKNIELFSKFLMQHHSSIKTILIDKEGHEHDYTQYEGDEQAIKMVRMEFFMHGIRYKPSPLWEPKDITNLYMFYLE